VRDSAEAYINWQSPPQFNDGGGTNHIRPGQTIDIKLGVQKPVVPKGDSVVDPSPNTN
jgi:hypothetical protein